MTSHYEGQAVSIWKSRAANAAASSISVDCSRTSEQSQNGYGIQRDSKAGQLLQRILLQKLSRHGRCTRWGTTASCRLRLRKRRGWVQIQGRHSRLLRAARKGWVGTGASEAPPQSRGPKWALQMHLN